MIRLSILVASWCLALAAGAQDVRPSIEVVAAGNVEITSAMADRIRSLERRLSISVVWEERDAIDARDVLAPRAADPAMLARVWLDLTSPDRALLFIANDANDRFLVRIVPTEGGYGELTQESLATIVDTAIEALRSGGRIGVDRSTAVRAIAEVDPEVAQPEAVPVAQVVRTDIAPVRAAPRAALASAIGVRYRGDVLDDRGAMRHAPELALSLTGFFDPTLDLVVLVTAQYWAPYVLGDVDRNVMLHGGGGRAALGVTGSIDNVFVWQVAIGGGADILSVSPHVAPETGLRAADPFVLVSPMLSALASASLRPAAWLEIVAGAGLDADLAGNHFDVQTAGARDPVIAPWAARPFVFVGLGVLFDARGGA